jgi:hypothetical protein
MATERILDNIEAIVSDIEQIERGLSFSARQASDREAFDIIRFELWTNLGGDSS